jgi:hypothetical protein
MNLQGRNLVFGMSGNDVRELQRDLTWLGVGIASQESKTDDRFWRDDAGGGTKVCSPLICGPTHMRDIAIPIRESDFEGSSS